MVHCTNRQKHSKPSKPFVTGLPRLYQQCTNGVPIVKNSQNSTKMTTGVPIVKVYQDCTNSVPTVYQSSKTVKTAKITIGIPIVTCLRRVCRIHKVRVHVYVRRLRPRSPSASASASAEYTKPNWGRQKSFLT